MQFSLSNPGILPIVVQGSARRRFRGGMARGDLLEFTGAVGGGGLHWAARLDKMLLYLQHGGPVTGLGGGAKELEG